MILQPLDQLEELGPVVRGIDFFVHGEDRSIRRQDKSRSGRAEKISPIHRFFDDGVGRPCEMFFGIAGEKVGDVLFCGIAEMRPTGVTTQGNEIETGPVDCRRMRNELVVLPIAARSVVFHVNRNNCPAGQEVPQNDLLDRTRVNHLQFDVRIQLLARRYHRCE